jgi:hypothetical protein
VYIFHQFVILPLLQPSSRPSAGQEHADAPQTSASEQAPAANVDPRHFAQQLASIANFTSSLMHKQIGGQQQATASAETDVSVCFVFILIINHICLEYIT